MAAGAKFGLMARASLSASAGMVAVLFGAHHGILVNARVPDGGTFITEHPAGNCPGTPGITGVGFACEIQASATGQVKAGGNLLRRPLWLRLSFDGAAWQPAWSLDGSTWTKAGPVPRTSPSRGRGSACARPRTPRTRR